MEEVIGTGGSHRLASVGWLAPALAAAALFLVPWAFWLSRALPATHTARHWDVAWAGAWFDTLTTRGGGEFAVAAAEAAFVELPLAAFSLLGRS